MISDPSRPFPRPVRPASWREPAAWLAGAALLLAAGCGGDGGPPRFELSGSVTYQGRPVPRGYIVFTPDRAQGNDGPGGYAEIVDGQYQTPPGKGPIGGPHEIRVAGFDGQAYQDGPVTIPNGRPLFMEKTLRADLPKQAGTHDLIVPEAP